jgi:carotenoid cleavage dioxygenase
VLTDRIDDVPQEFPRVDERLVGRKHRYGYGVQIGTAWDHGDLLRYDFDRGTSERRDYGTGMGTMEAVFIPRHDRAAEDDGWIMSMVHNANDQTTELVVVSAQDFTGDPVARVLIPARVPYGYHGNWIPTGQ